MGRRAFVLGVVVAAVGVCAPVAWGAFPGRDGDLVVATGGGLELVAPATGVATSICADVVLCGHPARPSFSPNGRAIAFVDTTSGRLVVVAADGSCLWCLVGARLTAVTGSDSAFMPGDQTVTVGGRGLWRVGLTGRGARRLVKGLVDGAVWSSRGLVALVRGGFVWVGRPGRGKLRRLARGGSPSFSPDGARLAFARGGYVWITGVAGGGERRLVRGVAPAWSPDGRQIAYLGAGGVVEIITVHDGRPHRVGSVQGTALDWQPIPSSAKPGCKPPAGATVLASDSEAVVFSRDYDSVFYGCLKALGRTRLLLPLDAPESDGGLGVLAVRLAGRFAALELEGETDTTAGEDVTLFDLGGGETTDVADISWDWNDGPIYGLDSLALDSSGFTAWRITGPSPTDGAASYPMLWPIVAISCPSVSLCIAGDSAGNILSSTSPAGGPSAWSIAPEAPTQVIHGISCPSISLCVAVDSAGAVLASTTPAGGATAWTSSTPDQGIYLDAISCPSVSLCVAGGLVKSVGDRAAILTSTDPTGGAGAWISAPLSSGDGLVMAVSCPSVSLCVATTDNGDVLTSTDPTGGANAWTKATIDPGGLLPAVSCPSASLCVAGDQNGNIRTSTDPTGGTSAWTKAALDPGHAITVSCPSVSLCVAGDGIIGPFGNNLFTSTDPTAGASAWTKTIVGTAVDTVSCPSISLCLAADQHGNILTSSDPTGGANAWANATVDVFRGCPQTLAPCVSEQLFAHDDQGFRVVDTAPPGPINSIANVAFGGDSLALNWTHDGVEQQLELH